MVICDKDPIPIASSLALAVTLVYLIPICPIILPIWVFAFCTPLSGIRPVCVLFTPHLPMPDP